MQVREPISDAKGTTLTRFCNAYVPSNFHSPFRLLRNLIYSKRKASYYAILYMVMGLILAPLDWILQLFEKRLYAKAPPSRLPKIFICGAPRSGTTLFAQALIKYLPVYYFNNLTSIFPRSPIIASRLFGFFVRNNNKDISLKSFYGRTTKLMFPNDSVFRCC